MNAETATLYGVLLGKVWLRKISGTAAYLNTRSILDDESDRFSGGPRYAPCMDGRPTDALTFGEKEALRLYLRTSDPKRIGAQLGKSHHEIERRFKEARRKLGLNRTRDAAALLAMEEDNPAYQTAIYRDLVGGKDRLFDLIKPSSEGGWIATNLPFPTKGRPWNALPIGARFIAILAGMLILVATAVLLVSLAQTLTSLVRPR